MLNPREAATVCAALLYWLEEMTPHSATIQRPYFEELGLERFQPLAAVDIRQLIGRIQSGID